MAVVFPNQQSWGTHVNVAGGAMARHAKHRAEAVAFLEYLAGDEAQAYFADGNNEWPVVASVRVKNAELESLGKFKADQLHVSELGKNQPVAQRISDRAGYK